MLKVRLKFSKSGALVYIGHLDVMRYFQKLFRRASIPVAYSEGFSPHQLLSFTPPLPLGMESEGEYADVVLTEKISSDEALVRLRENTVNEIGIISFKELPEKCENAMASVKAAGYRISIGDKDRYDIRRMIDSLLNKDEIMVTKKTKKNEKIIDIRPLIYELKTGIDENTINMLISSGSTDNIKPELVLEALDPAFADLIEKSSMKITRTDQYTSNETGLISLDDIGRDII